MRVYEDKTYPATVRSICVARKCDLCGTQSADEDWDAGVYSDSETEISVTVKSRQAKYYGNDGESSSYTIDLCPQCFKGRLVPWLKSQGAAIQEENISW